MALYYFGSPFSAQYTGSFGITEEKEKMEILDLQKTAEKVRNAINRNPEGKVTLGNKTAKSILEHLHRLIDLEK